ncbi:TM7S3/TM198-like domain-containing protein [Christensenella tenuis]|jgi:hypothetical protein|uniref:DUF4203 domain-containing protein n=1 Tax=Christensenella tenuis TaxID=2763033 RepID=A0ABR7ECK2_9FIRM|nr:DUF4203 domain-containing protein [Christensenella tenuis]MBC5647507.1 DUF4203 domain-containing protein [Christensenella tenuis]
MTGIIPIIILLVMLVLGILYCFWGYKYLKVILFLYAFFMGVYYSYTYLGAYVPAVADWLWLVSLIIGIVFALLAFFFVKFAIFVVGGMVGLMIFDLLKQAFPSAFAGMEPLTLFFIGLGLFVVLGAVTLASRRHFVIIFSAIYGGYTLVSTVGIIIGLFFNADILSTVTLGNYKQVLTSVSVFNHTATWMLILPVVVFAIAGMIAQYKFTAPGTRRGKRTA